MLISILKNLGVDINNILVSSSRNCVARLILTDLTKVSRPCDKLRMPEFVAVSAKKLLKSYTS